MDKLKISLQNNDVLHVPCSALFVKHIEGTMSAPELSLNEAIDGKLQAAYARQEKDKDIKVASEGKLPFEAIYALNFHRDELPFTYTSVDSYARRILAMVLKNQGNGGANISTIATAVHGPGAGLDTSEAMETLLTAFVSELHSIDHLGSLNEIILVEKDKNVYDRLWERLKFLKNKGIVIDDGDSMFLPMRHSHFNSMLEPNKLKENSLRHIFVAMPFAKEFNNLYYFGIKEPVERKNLKCERVDHEHYVGDVVERIKERISTAQLVIADITGESANVYFEVGYATGCGKPIIILSQEQDAPFDLRTQKQIRYDPQDILSVSQKLRETLNALLPD